MKTFDVEIAGCEKSVYGGADGHYCGTTITLNKVCDFMELSEEYFDMIVRFYKSMYNHYITIVDVNPYLYWDVDHHRIIQEPKTENGGIRISRDLYDKVVFKELGWKEYLEGHFMEYWDASNNLQYKQMTVKDLQEILK